MNKPYQEPKSSRTSKKFEARQKALIRSQNVDPMLRCHGIKDYRYLIKVGRSGRKRRIAD
jgi:hypothetical protein